MKTIQLNRSDYWEDVEGATLEGWGESRILNGLSVGEADKSGYTIMRNNKRVPTWVNLRQGGEYGDPPDDYWGYIDEKGEVWKVEWM